MIRSLVNWNPAAELEQFSNVMDRMWNSVLEPTNGSQMTTFALPVDIFERDGSLFVRAAVPGVKPEDLDISIEKDVLTIRGETKSQWSEEDQNLKVYRREYRYGTFNRSIRLPQNLNFEQVEAEFDNGFVTIRLPRIEEPKPQARKVPVKSAAHHPQSGKTEVSNKTNKN
ncbi:MAG TPA: Hsp20/alpha crystallin family protein [Fimbriimonadaceae bacterium]|nr:Hsp20/alpha crystallin family protein [Fimbriimonadaceae bacterium]